jgi:hypothetical protein
MFGVCRSVALSNKGCNRFASFVGHTHDSWLVARAGPDGILREIAARV